MSLAIVATVGCSSTTVESSRGTDEEPPETDSESTGAGSSSGSSGTTSTSGTASSGRDDASTGADTESSTSDGGDTSTGGSSSGGEGDSSSGDDGGTTGGTIEPGDAQDVDWPEDCEHIASEAFVCLSVGTDFDAWNEVVVALSIETGATCTLHTAGNGSGNVHPNLGWIGNSLLLRRDLYDAAQVLDLDTGEIETADLVDGGTPFDWAEGVIVDLPGNNLAYYDSAEGLLSNAPVETYSGFYVGNRGFTVGDVLHTYDSDGHSSGSMHIPTGDEVLPFLLPEFAYLDGAAVIGDALAVLSNETIYMFDLDSGEEIGTQPIAFSHLRGLACSPGVQP